MLNLLWGYLCRLIGRFTIPMNTDLHHVLTVGSQFNTEGGVWVFRILKCIGIVPSPSAKIPGILTLHDLLLEKRA